MNQINIGQQYQWSAGEQGRSISLGRIGEQAARELYKKNSFTILASNFFNRRGKRLGEIDFVALKRKHLHFVEVKARSSQKFGDIREQIGLLKKMKIVRAARFFISRFPSFAEHNIHFDVIFVQFEPFDKRPNKITICSDAIDV